MLPSAAFHFDICVDCILYQAPAQFKYDAIAQIAPLEMKHELPARNIEKRIEDFQNSTYLMPMKFITQVNEQKYSLVYRAIE